MTAGRVDIEQARRLASEAKARADKATDGPWRGWIMDVYAGSNDLDQATLVATTHYVGADGRSRTNDLDFIVAARADVPALYESVVALADEIERLRAVERRVEGLEQATREVASLLEMNGCDCECEHHAEEHRWDCDRCFACLVSDPIQEAINALSEKPGL